MTYRIFALIGLIVFALATGFASSPAQAVGMQTFTTSTPVIAGGKSVTTTIRLAAPAPTGGQRIEFSVSNSYATPPADVTIAAGRSSFSVRFTTRAVARDVRVTLSAVAGGSSMSVSVLLQPAKLNGVSTPTNLVSGASSQGSVRVDVAPVADMEISLRSADPAMMTVPATLIIPAGKTSAMFAITTGRTSSGSVVITATHGAVTRTDSTAIAPAKLSSVTTPSTLVVGKTGTGTVTLTGVTWTDLVVSLTSSKPEYGTTPNRVTVPAGNRTVTFTMNSVAPGTTYITAGSRGVTKEDSTKVLSAGVSSISVPYVMQPNAAGTGTINLTGPAPAGGVQVQLVAETLTEHVPLLFPQTVTIPAGKESQTFALQAGAPLENSLVTIKATLNGVEKKANTNVLAGSPGIRQITTSDLSQVASNTSVGFTVSLTGPLEAEHLDIQVSSSHPDIAPVPPTMTINQGDGSGGMDLTMRSVTSPTQVTITFATLAGSKSVQFWVYPAVVSQTQGVGTEITGGFDFQVNYQITGPAMTGGATLYLTASDPSVLSVPASLTIPEGSNNAWVWFSSLSASDERTVTISASAGPGSPVHQLILTIHQLGIESINNGQPIELDSDEQNRRIEYVLSSESPFMVFATITSSNPDVLQVSSDGIIPANSTRGDFQLTAGWVSESTDVTITVQIQGGGSASITVTVLPGTPPAPPVSPIITPTVVPVDTATPVPTVAPTETATPTEVATNTATPGEDVTPDGD